MIFKDISSPSSRYGILYRHTNAFRRHVMIKNGLSWWENLRPGHVKRIEIENVL